MRNLSALLLGALLAVSANAAMLIMAAGGGAPTDEGDPDPPEGDLVAFPGAEGFGAFATGGRGGYVCVVTNTNDSGAGSLRTCLKDDEPRIVVFRTSGVIALDSNLDLAAENNGLTILGQSSPGGITITGGSLTTNDAGLENVIVRNLRFRPAGGGDTIGLNYVNDLILDHVDLCCSSDETLDLDRSKTVTVQWSVIQNSNNVGQAYGFLLAYEPTSNVTFHHNFSANHYNRCGWQVHWGAGTENVPPAGANIEATNNVIYNCDFQQIFRSDGDGTASTLDANWNFKGNYVKAGPDTPGSSCIIHLGTLDNGENYVYETGNEYDDGDVFCPFSDHMLASEHGFPEVTTTSAAQAYTDVLALSGAWPRDEMTWRTMREARENTGTLSDISDPLSTYAPAAWTDTDNDGIPDSAEAALGLSSSNGSDSATLHANGYAYVEHYWNTVAPSKFGADTTLVAKAKLLSGNQSILVSTVAESSLFDDGTPIYQWGSTLCYDPLRRKLRFIGKRFSSYNYHTLQYDELTDSWSKDGTWDIPAALTSTTGHGYDANACDPTTGDHYFAQGDHVYPWSRNVWGSAIAAAGNMTPGPADGLCYVPSLGPVWVADDFFRYWNGSSWVELNSDSASVTDYHMVCEWNRTANVMLIGAGNMGNTLRKWDVAGASLSTISTPDINCGASETQGVLTTVPDDDKFVCKEKASNAWRVYDVSADIWSNLTQSSGDGSSAQSGTPNFDNTSGVEICGAVYLVEATKVIACIEHDSTDNEHKLWLYKVAGLSATEDRHVLAA